MKEQRNNNVESITDKHPDIQDAILELQEEIKEKEQYIHMIEAIDWEEPINEEQWHLLCETALRNSNMLVKLAKNTFPDAQDIKVGCNYVWFVLYGFECAIPTSRRNGIEVKMDWYKKDCGEPKMDNIIPEKHKQMKQYFEALDNGASWDTLLLIRTPQMRYYNKLIRCLMWFTNYKWKNPNRQEWMEVFKEDECRYEQALKHYHNKRTDMEERIARLENKVLPKLRKFTTIINCYDSNLCPKTINSILYEEIDKKEKIG